MRLANDIVAITIDGGPAVRLRPTLRAAVRLHDAYGLPELVRQAVAGDSMAVAVDIITEGTDPETAARLIARMLKAGLQQLPRLRDPFADFLFALLGVDRHNLPKDGKSPSDASDWIGAYLEELFEIGTGWLGWSPAVTWAATPTEIIIAQRGLVAKLKAIHGSAEKDNSDTVDKATVRPAIADDGDLAPEAVQASIDKLRALSGKAA